MRDLFALQPVPTLLAASEPSTDDSTFWAFFIFVLLCVAAAAFYQHERLAADATAVRTWSSPHIQPSVSTERWFPCYFPSGPFRDQRHECNLLHRWRNGRKRNTQA